MDDNGVRDQEIFKSDVKFKAAVISIARFIHDYVDNSARMPRLYWLKGVLTAYPQQAEFFSGINLSGVAVNNGIVLIPYERGGKEYIIELVPKELVTADKLIGFEIDISPEYYAKIVPKGYAAEAKVSLPALEKPVATVSGDVRVLSSFLSLRDEIKDPVDIAIVCGNDRLDTVFETAKLYKAGLIKNVIFSGGVGRLTAGLADSVAAYIGMDTKDLAGLSEAELFKIVFVQDLLRSGMSMSEIEKANIYLESKSKNGQENLIFSRDLILANGLSASSIMVIQAPEMQRRADRTFEKWVRPSFPGVLYYNYAAFLPSDAALSNNNYIAAMIDEAEKLQIYSQPRFGFIAPLNINGAFQGALPAAVKEAIYSLQKKLFPGRFIEIANKLKAIFIKTGERARTDIRAPIQIESALAYNGTSFTNFSTDRYQGIVYLKSGSAYAEIGQRGAKRRIDLKAGDVISIYTNSDIVFTSDSEYTLFRQTDSSPVAQPTKESPATSSIYRAADGSVQATLNNASDVAIGPGADIELTPEWSSIGIRWQRFAAKDGRKATIDKGIALCLSGTLNAQFAGEGLVAGKEKSLVAGDLLVLEPETSVSLDSRDGLALVISANTQARVTPTGEPKEGSIIKDALKTAVETTISTNQIRPPGVNFLLAVIGVITMALSTSCTIAGESVRPDNPPAATQTNDQNKKIAVNGRRLIVNNQPYLIKGLCWHPVAPGRDRRDGTDYIGAYKVDIRLMAALGVNTIRTYEPIEEKVILDALNEAGIKVIMGFPNYDDRKVPGPDIRGGDIYEYIAKFKDHPAILMWQLGNEYNYHPEWFDHDIKKWYTVMNNAAAKIHEIDPLHPVTTAHGELPTPEVFKMGANLDLGGLNIYRGPDPSALFPQFAERSPKPVFLSEMGDRDADEKKRAANIVKIWASMQKAFNEGMGCGGLFFALRNETWKGADDGWGLAGTLAEDALRAVWKDGKSPEDVLKAIEAGPDKKPSDGKKLYSIEPFSLAFVLSLGAPVLILALLGLTYMYLYPYIYTRIRLWKYFGYSNGNRMYAPVKKIIANGKAWRLKKAGDGIFSTDTAKVIVDSVCRSENLSTEFFSETITFLNATAELSSDVSRYPKSLNSGERSVSYKDFIGNIMSSRSLPTDTVQALKILSQVVDDNKVVTYKNIGVMANGIEPITPIVIITAFISGISSFISEHPYSSLGVIGIAALAVLISIVRSSDRRSIEVNIAKLSGNDKGQTDRAMAALIEYGPIAVPKLVLSLRGDSDPLVRMRVAEILGNQMDISIVEALADARRDTDERVRQAAVNALQNVNTGIGKTIIQSLVREQIIKIMQAQAERERVYLQIDGAVEKSIHNAVETINLGDKISIDFVTASRTGKLVKMDTQGRDEASQSYGRNLQVVDVKISKMEHLLAGQDQLKGGPTQGDAGTGTAGGKPIVLIAGVQPVVPGSIEPAPSKGTILVTGGAGYIGSHAARKLLQAGYDVIVVDNFVKGRSFAVERNMKIAGILGRRFVFAEGDLGDREFLDTVFSSNKIDSVMHFAAYTEVGESVSRPATYFQNNVVNTVRLLDAMTVAGVKRIVFSSSAAVYGNPESVPISENNRTEPINPYGFTKLAMEKVIKSYQDRFGMKWVALRYFNASGASLDGQLGEAHSPESHLIPVAIARVLAGDKMKVFGTDYGTKDGTALRDYIGIEDLTEAHILALEASDADVNRAYNLGSGNGYTVKEVVEMVGRKVGIFADWFDAGRRAGDPEALVASAGAFKLATGWKPATSDIETIVSSAVDWYKNMPKEGMEPKIIPQVDEWMLAFQVQIEIEQHPFIDKTVSSEIIKRLDSYMEAVAVREEMDAKPVPALPVPTMIASSDIGKQESATVEPKPISDEAKKLFDIVEKTVNNSCARFVIDANALVKEFTDISAVKAKYTDISFTESMTTAELNEKLAKLTGRFEPASHLSDLPEEMYDRLHKLESDFTKVEIDRIVVSIIARAKNTEKGQRLIIGLETDWIPGMDDKGYGTQHDAINPLLRELDSLGASLKAIGLDNVDIIHRSKSELEDAILKRADETKTGVANIIILASGSTVKSMSGSGKFSVFDPQSGKTEKAFFAGVDPSKLVIDKGQVNTVADVDIVQLLALTLELALGKEPPKIPLIFSYDRQNRVVIFMPEARPVDYALMREIYEAQRQALTSL